MNNSQYLTPAKGYKFLPTIIEEQITAHLEHKDKPIHPLVESVAQFDRSFNYTDDGSVWRNANLQMKELTDEIAESTEFTEEQKDSLYEGLDLDGLPQLRETFPELKQHIDGPLYNLVDMIVEGTYDEERIERTLTTINLFEDVLSNTVVPWGTYLVWSPKGATTNKFSRQDYNTLTLSKASNDKLQPLLKQIVAGDIDYLSRMQALLSTYVNVGTDGSPNYQSATLLPVGTINARISETAISKLLTIHSTTIDWSMCTFI